MPVLMGREQPCKRWACALQVSSRLLQVLLFMRTPTCDLYTLHGHAACLANRQCV